MARRRARNSEPKNSGKRDALHAAAPCWLCGRVLGRRVEWHHPFPKSQGRRETVPMHPICHRAIHAHFTNKELARMAEAGAAPNNDPGLQRFLAWIAGKPPDFHAPTRVKR